MPGSPGASFANRFDEVILPTTASPSRAFPGMPGPPYPLHDEIPHLSGSDDRTGSTDSTDGSTDAAPTQHPLLED